VSRNPEFIFDIFHNKVDTLNVFVVKFILSHIYEMLLLPYYVLMEWFHECIFVTYVNHHVITC